MNYANVTTVTHLLAVRWNWGTKQMDLQQLREQYPFRPYQHALLDSKTLVEVISYPWQECTGPDQHHTSIDGTRVHINVRINPGDPTSMQEVDAARLKRLPLEDTAEPVDPDSVDGLIAKLQALPADVRKLKVLLPDHYGEEMVKPNIRVIEGYGEDDQPERVVLL